MPILKSLKSTFLIIALIFLLQFSKIEGHVDHNDDGYNSNANLHSKSLILVKIWCSIILFASVFIGGMTPYFFRRNETFLLLGTEFAAGLFLGTALIHFLSDSNETFQYFMEYYMENASVSYPFVFVLASFGYLLMMFVDCLIAKRGDEFEGVGVEADNHHQECVVNHLHGYGLTRTASWWDAVLLILGLCCHSVFEGIAVGVADTKADAWRNLWTISLYKIFAAVGMGTALLKMIPTRQFLTAILYSLSLAISSPIGVVTGISLNATTQGQAADLIYIFSMGIASGVFLYVSINHLIAKGFQAQDPIYFDTPFYKFLAFCLGVAVVAIVLAFN